MQTLSNAFEMLNKLIGCPITFFRLNDFGFPNACKCTLVSVRLEPYAQYRETLVMIFVQKGKRKAVGIRVFAKDTLLVYGGHVDLAADMFMGGNESLPCFDNGYTAMALNSTSAQPLIQIAD